MNWIKRIKGYKDLSYRATRQENTIKELGGLLEDSIEDRRELHEKVRRLNLAKAFYRDAATSLAELVSVPFTLQAIRETLATISANSVQLGEPVWVKFLKVPTGATCRKWYKAEGLKNWDKVDLTQTIKVPLDLRIAVDCLEPFVSLLRFDILRKETKEDRAPFAEKLIAMLYYHDFETYKAHEFAGPTNKVSKFCKDKLGRNLQSMFNLIHQNIDLL